MWEHYRNRVSKLDGTKWTLGRHCVLLIYYYYSRTIMFILCGLWNLGNQSHIFPHTVKLNKFPHFPHFSKINFSLDEIKYKNHFILNISPSFSHLPTLLSNTRISGIIHDIISYFKQNTLSFLRTINLFSPLKTTHEILYFL